MIDGLIWYKQTKTLTRIYTKLNKQTNHDYNQEILKLILGDSFKNIKR